jgi:aspartate carbamoyltransferase catalytic subunit
MDTAEVRNPNTSSELKGETQTDSLRTMSSYFDLIIIRSEAKDLACQMAKIFNHIERPIPVINGGSGSDEHPTQALLDMYTFERSFENLGGIDGKHIAFAGDLKRSRVVRSLLPLLDLYEDVKLTLISPKSLRMDDEILSKLKNCSIREADEIEDVVRIADAFYITRVQDEWDVYQGESSRICLEQYSIRKRHLDMMKETAIIMHPLPRREEISPEIDSDHRAMYWRQVRNGMWIRVALIAAIFDLAPHILAYDATRGTIQ